MMTKANQRRPIRTAKGEVIEGACPTSLPPPTMRSCIVRGTGHAAPLPTYLSPPHQAVESSIDRLAAVLEGKEDPGAPRLLYTKGEKQTATYKTKAETDEKRGVYVGVFGALMFIAFVAPMVQFFGYTKDD